METRYRLEVGNGFETSPAVIAAGNEAIGAWLICALWSIRNGTPGQISAVAYAPYGQRVVTALVKAGLWERDTPGYAMVPSRYWRFAKITRRQAILASLRDRIYRRDGYRCKFCGSEDDLTLDHIHPKSLGGPDTEENLQTLCRPCNSSKGAQI